MFEPRCSVTVRADYSNVHTSFQEERAEALGVDFTNKPSG